MIRLRCGNQRIGTSDPAAVLQVTLEVREPTPLCRLQPHRSGALRPKLRLAAKVKRAAVEGAAGIIRHGPSRLLGLAANLVDHSKGENLGNSDSSNGRRDCRKRRSSGRRHSQDKPAAVLDGLISAIRAGELEEFVQPCGQDCIDRQSPVRQCRPCPFSNSKALHRT